MRGLVLGPATAAGAMAFGTVKAERGRRVAWQGPNLDATEQTATAPPANTGFAARCLLRHALWATLATTAAGQPFASLVTHAVAPDGAALLLISALAQHTQHLMADPRCALMVVGAPENANWQTAPRLTITGTAAPLADPAARAYWVARHPYAAGYAQFTDFTLWRLQPHTGLFVAGFGRIQTLNAAELLCPEAAVTALAQPGLGIVDHCNTDHAEALNRVARAAGASGHWRMLGVDMDGFDLVQDDTILRIAFPAPVQDAPGVRAALIGLAEAARRHF